MASKFVIPEFSAGALKDIMSRQEAHIAVYLRQDPRKQRINPRACVFWDDYNGKVKRGV